MTLIVTVIDSACIFINDNHDIQLVLLKTLPLVCMKYTARDESRVANIARGEAECYICHETLIKSCILSYKRSGSASSVLLYFKLKDVLTEDIPLIFNTFNE